MVVPDSAITVLAADADAFQATSGGLRAALTRVQDPDIEQLPLVIVREQCDMLDMCRYEALCRRADRGQLHYSIVVMPCSSETDVDHLAAAANTAQNPIVAKCKFQHFTPQTTSIRGSVEIADLAAGVKHPVCCAFASKEGWHEL